MKKPKAKSFWLLKELFRRVIVIIGAVLLTLAFFLVLPVMQSIAKPPETDLIVQSVNTAKLEAPDPVQEIEEPEPEEQPEEQPPKLADDVQPIDLQAMEIALNTGIGEGVGSGDFVVNLNKVVSESQNTDALFSIADLDQKPRVIYQTGVTLSKEAKKRMPGRVKVIFIVDKNGRVENPVVKSASDPIFEKFAIATVKKWKFEPGKRNGKPVRFRMLAPVSFSK
ncbi:MAG: TonB family protein [Phycisphaerae bacterium]|nr:TonB family protein [Phycisphaerae bacterium]